MSNQFLGEVRVFGCNFAPVGWAACDGQVLQISQSTALFSLFGTYYGGDGIRSFGLPNMQGNIPISQGQGQGLSQYVIGEKGGTSDVTLLLNEMPSHNHNMMADPDDAPASSPTPANNALCVGAMFSNATSPLVQMYNQMIKPVGGNLPHNNMMPYLTLNFCVALQGIFPSRP
jgi:microcystin-dependent protein